MAKPLDRLDRRLLRELQTDARLSLAELGRRVGLSSPALAERLRRLEERGVIQGYRTDIDSHALGYPVTALIRLFVPAERYPRIEALLADMPEVREAFHVTGEAAFVLKVVAPSLADLERLIAVFDPHGRTETAVVLSTRLAPRPLPIEEAAG